MASGPIKAPIDSNTDYTDIIGRSAKYTVRNEHPYYNRYLIREKVCHVTLQVTCVSPASGSEVIANVPAVSSALGTNVQFELRNYYFANDHISALIQSGILYFIGGVAGRDYGINISYPID